MTPRVGRPTGKGAPSRDGQSSDIAEGVGIMRSLIAGNWKMNSLLVDGLERVGAIAARADGANVCDVLLCPPATLLGELAARLRESAILLGAQDCHAEVGGAFTGDVSAPMLADIGCSHVIVGHSERRRGHGETDALVAAKARAAHDAGLVAIVCLGESAEQRDAGKAGDIVREQLRRSVPPSADGSNTIVAYEPVWAIGTGDTATPDDVAAMHRTLREDLLNVLGDGGAGVRLLYGGSVNAGNAVDLLAIPDVDGALVGGASLNADAFWKIVESGRTT